MSSPGGELTIHRRRLAIAVALACIGLLLGFTIPAAPASAKTRATAKAARMKHCSLPAAGAPYTQATPAQEDLRAADVNAAVQYATTHGRDSLQIFRNNCLVATEALPAVTDSIPANIFSSTKSVVSMLAGIAVAQHRLSLNAPIGDYLPSGWGDSAHRAITVRDLLTETSGIREAILSEAGTVGLDPNVCQEALAQPIEHAPGSHFEYSQRDPDLLGCVVEGATKENLETYAQQHLFGPIGIEPGTYWWFEDRSGNPYGYAFLYLTPTEFSRLGLLVQNGGVWRGERVVPAAYLTAASQPSARNGCYGYLFWTNAGQPCTSANIPAARTYDRNLIPAAPSDTYAMIGALQQNNFMIRSLHMTVTWTGMFGDQSLDLEALISAAPGADLYDNFFRRLMAGVEDQKIRDPGPYSTPPLDLDIDPDNYASPQVLLTDVFPNSNCNVVACDGSVPTSGGAQTLQSGLAALLNGFGAI